MFQILYNIVYRKMKGKKVDLQTSHIKSMSIDINFIAIQYEGSILLQCTRRLLPIQWALLHIKGWFFVHKEPTLGSLLTLSAICRLNYSLLLSPASVLSRRSDLMLHGKNTEPKTIPPIKVKGFWSTVRLLAVRSWLLILQSNVLLSAMVKVNSFGCIKKEGKQASKKER